MNNLTFITGNAGKAKYLSDYFSIPIEHKKLDLKEIQSLDLREVVEDKVRRAFEIVQAPVLVEDVSLTFSSLKALPGPLIKWFLDTLGNEGLCKLAGTLEDRIAFAEVMFAFFDGENLHTFSSSTSGTISSSPKGEKGFGWDQVFIPDGYAKTWAEMSEAEKHETSMRKTALQKLLVFLRKEE